MPTNRISRRDFISAGIGAAAAGGAGLDAVNQPFLAAFFSINGARAEQLAARSPADHLEYFDQNMQAVRDGYQTSERPQYFAVTDAAVKIFRGFLQRVVQFERVPAIGVKLSDFKMACVRPQSASEMANVREYLFVEGAASGLWNQFGIAPNQQARMNLDGTGPAITTMIDMQRLVGGEELTRSKANEAMFAMARMGIVAGFLGKLMPDGTINQPECIVQGEGYGYPVDYDVLKEVRTNLDFIWVS